jgi:hypothetical protein
VRKTSKAEYEREQDEIEAMMEELKSSIKMALFDLYDRCMQPIARVIGVEYLYGVGKHGESYIAVEIEAQKLSSSHFEAIKRVNTPSPIL